VSAWRPTRGSRIKLRRRLLILSLAGLVWGNGGYLVLLLVMRRFLTMQQTPQNPADDDSLPSVTAAVLAYNEQDAMPEKLQNLLELDYPEERLLIVVASDGSDDATNAIVEEHPSDRVRLLASPKRRGRALMTNDVIADAVTEWVLFTDADTRMERDFLRRLAPHLVQPDVGVADGSMICVNGSAAGLARDVGLYWRYESLVKQAETKLGCLATTFGACTVIRRSVFRPLKPSEDVDFTTPLDAIVQGYRVVHEPRAVVYERTHSSSGEQYRARVRMVTKNLPGTLRKLPSLVGRPHIVLAIASHKLLRWFSPFLLLSSLICNLGLTRSRGFRRLLGAQGLFYGAAAAGGLAAHRGRSLPLVSQAYSFVLANAGFLVGVINAIRRKEITTWQPHAPSSGEGET
jgi:glycosyltransferase involved in cell wall biosynthesis